MISAVKALPIEHQPLIVGLPWDQSCLSLFGVIFRTPPAPVSPPSGRSKQALGCAAIFAPCIAPMRPRRFGSYVPPRQDLQFLLHLRRNVNIRCAKMLHVFPSREETTC